MCIFFFLQKHPETEALPEHMPCIFATSGGFKGSSQRSPIFVMKVTARIIPAPSLGAGFHPLPASQAPTGEERLWQRQEGLVGAQGDGAGRALAPVLWLGVTSHTGSAAASSEFVNTFARQKGDYKVLTSSRDVSEMPCKLSASAELPPGAAWRAGTPRHGTARQRERAASPPGTKPSGHAGLSHLNLPVLINPSGKRNK